MYFYKVLSLSVALSHSPVLTSPKMWGGRGGGGGGGNLNQVTTKQNVVLSTKGQSGLPICFNCSVVILHLTQRHWSQRHHVTTPSRHNTISSQHHHVTTPLRNNTITLTMPSSSLCHWFIKPSGHHVNTLGYLRVSWLSAITAA